MQLDKVLGEQFVFFFEPKQSENEDSNFETKKIRMKLDSINENVVSLNKQMG